MLFDVNPQAAFLPSVDPTIKEASIARRRRRIHPGKAASQGNGKNDHSGALTVVAGSGNDTTTATGTTGGSTTASTALTRTDNSDAASNEGKGGILVVRKSCL